MTKILVVDDDILVLATTCMGLTQAGYEVMQAEDGVLALQLCEQEKPDLALLDISMPAMNGFELAKILNKQMIPFIFLTAYSEQDLVKSAAALGAVGYLVKPIEISRIVPVLEVALMRADEYTKAGQTIENLVNNLEKNRAIDVSIGMLMERCQFSRVSAFEYLRKYARSKRMKVVEVANAFIAGSIGNDWSN
ncbi:MAG: response regulator [Methylococcales bacterium]